jgi:hypothetical protein
VNAVPQRLSIAVIVIIATTSLPLEAQDSTSAAAFEVASIKPRTGERVVGGTTTPDRFARADATLRNLIRYAFDLQDFQIEGGPEWVVSSRFEVTAKAAGAPSGPDGMRALVRRLLQCETTSTDPRCRTRFNTKMTSATGNQPPGIYSMTLVLEGTTMARLAGLLQNEVRRAIVDRTGLIGTFDLELEFAPQGPRPVGLPPGPAPTPSDGPPLATAIQEQLGLRLESARGHVPVLVVDSATLPTPD